MFYFTNACMFNVCVNVALQLTGEAPSVRKQEEALRPVMTTIIIIPHFLKPESLVITRVGIE